MARAFGLVLTFLAVGLAVLHGIVTLNPLSIFEGGLLAANAFVVSPGGAEKKP